MSSFITGGPCATLHAFWISPLRQNWNCSEVRMLKKIQSSKHIQQMKLSQSLNYSITMSCSFASKRVDIWNWPSIFFCKKVILAQGMCSVLGLVDDRFSVNVSSIFFWYVFAWSFMWRGIQMLKIYICVSSLKNIKYLELSTLPWNDRVHDGAGPLYCGGCGKSPFVQHRPTFCWTENKTRER